ncbi:MAG: glycoside hydrolase family 3 C-terminal domain-containing protein [Oscillospiraceae bacterium]|jgi:beta-glucosidase|nr:glycoside hydrolase family 3 C-terminal domain-containing protein [Oscillospiraceae bacterium]
MSKEKIKELISEMTPEEKAGLLSGFDCWTTKSIERLNIPAIAMSDGPHGLRKQKRNELGTDRSYPSTCFPTACLLACSWDGELAEKQGAAIGKEARAFGLGCVLGPGANIKRGPLCGRNFEYFSEEPLLSGRMAAGVINGLQSLGISACLKHFAVNNQEDFRFWVDAWVDDRALREIYLASFEYALAYSKPKAVMCSYNKLNGVYASENRWLLTDILRGEWGYDGIVMSDWGAVNNRAQGVWAGLDLEMPGSYGVNDAQIVKAAKGEETYFAPTVPDFSGSLAETEIDACVERMLEFIFDLEHTVEPVPCDFAPHHGLAREIAAECMVLLENDGVLPLRKGMNVAVIGEMAVKPRIQGGGSSRVVPRETDNPLDEIAEYAAVTYARGYSLDEPDDVSFIAEAVKAAVGKDAVIVIAGLPDGCESEGYDRKHLGIPYAQAKLIDEIIGVNPNTAVVVCAGAPVNMTFAKAFDGSGGNRAAAVLMAYLGGEAAGGAIADLLFGVKNPCGKLAETFPMHLSDTPCYLNFPGDGKKVCYGEGIFVGYRWYDETGIAPLFPFGHGLSYTEFEYSDLTVSVKDGGFDVSVKVANTGRYDGKEVIQVYVTENEVRQGFCGKELKAFKKIALKKGESQIVTLELDRRAFAHWDDDTDSFNVAGGEYIVQTGGLSEIISVEGDKPVPKVTMYSDVGSLFGNPNAKEFLREVAAHFGTETPDAPAEADCSDFRWYMLRNLVTMGGIKWTFGELQEKIDKINGNLRKPFSDGFQKKFCRTRKIDE